MKTKRQKTSTNAPTQADFIGWVNRVGVLQIDIANNKAAMEKELQEVRDRYEAQIAPNKKENDNLLKRGMKYIRENEEDVLPAGKRSSETELCYYGLRTGMPTIAGVGKKTFAMIVADIIALGEEQTKTWLTYKDPTLNKDKIRIEMPPEQKKQLGIIVTQDETFWIAHKEKMPNPPESPEATPSVNS